MTKPSLSSSSSPTSGVQLSRRTLRRIGLVAALVGGYFLLLWLLPMLVDKQALRTDVRRWLESAAGYRSPVTLEEVDVALRATGRGDLYLKHVRLDSPNPEFDRPFLRIETVRVSAPAASVLLGWGTAPVVQVRSAALRLERDPFDELNVADFFRPSSGQPASAPFPLFRHCPDILIFQLMRNRLIWQDRPQRQEAAMLVEGVVEVHSGAGEWVGHLQPTRVEYTYRGEERNQTTTFDLWVQRIQFDRGATGGEAAAPIALRNLALDVSDMPLRAGTLFRYPVPPFLEETTVSGRFEYADGRVFFDGTAQGLQVPGVEVPATVTVRVQPFGGVEMVAGEAVGEGESGILLELKGDDDFHVRVVVHPDARDGRIRLYAEVPVFDLDAYRATCDGTRGWVCGASRTLAGLTLHADRIRLGGFDLEEAELVLARPQGAKESVSVQGSGAGGAFQMLARGTDLIAGGLPESCKIQYAVGRLDAFWMALARAWTIPVGIPVRGGAGEAFLELERENGTPRWRMRAALTDVELSTLTGGLLIQELASLPQQMVAAENLRRRSQIPPLPMVVPSLETRPALSYPAVLLDVVLEPEGRLHALQVMARDPQRGELVMTGGVRNGSPLRMEVRLRGLPETAYAHPDLSAGIRDAARTVMQEEGFRILHTFTGRGWTIERPYIQAIFRHWNLRHLTPPVEVPPVPSESLPEPSL